MIRMTCPVCKSGLQTSDEKAGRVLSCPTCRHRMVAESAAPVASFYLPDTAITTPKLVAGNQAAGEGRGMPIWKKLLREAHETGRATWGQTGRLFAFAFGKAHQRSLNKAARQARLALGYRLMGQSRTKMDQFNQFASAITPKLQQERFILDLAQQAMALPTAPPGVEGDCQRAKEAQARVLEQETKMNGAGVFPGGLRDWRRVILGYSTLACLLLITALGFARYGWDASQSKPDIQVAKAELPVTPRLSNEQVTPYFPPVEPSGQCLPSDEPVTPRLLEGVPNDKAYSSHLIEATPVETSDIVDLVDKHLVEVSFVNKQMNQFVIDVMPNGYNQKVVIPAGTVFRPNGNYQNEVVVKTVVIDNLVKKTRCPVATCCANQEMPFGSTASYKICKLPEDSKVRQLCVELSTSNCPIGQCQQRVWQLTRQYPIDGKASPRQPLTLQPPPARPMSKR